MYSLRNKISNKDQNELFIQLAKGLSLLHSAEEMAQFIKDLLSQAEVLMLARRLQIAHLLIEGYTYEQIRIKLKVGQGTIARVQTWLNLYGEGYRTVIKRMPKKKQTETTNSKPFSKLKRNYPMYFWPQLLLEEIVKSANKREKQRLMAVIDQMKEKTKLTRELSRLLTFS